MRVANFDPLQTLGFGCSVEQMVRPVLIIAAAPSLIALCTCTEPRHLPRLSALEAEQCKGRGGFESSGGFGEPICQFRYTDAGKACSGKADCEGECVSRPKDGSPVPDLAAGTPMQGQCAAEQSLLGCFALVQGGKLVTGYQCAD